MNPQVSFIVPCYNYGRFVSQAVDSLLGQTLEGLEIIAINDASTDDTASVLDRYEGTPRVRVIHHQVNMGHLRTYNEGIALARGKYIGILSADDYCTNPDTVRRQVAVFTQHPSVGMVYTGHQLIHPDGIVSTVLPGTHSYVRAGVEEFRALIWGNYVPHSGTLLRADVQAGLGPYDMRLPHTGDWDMWLRTAARHDVGYVAEPLYAYRMHRKNMRHTAVTVQGAADEGRLTLERAFAALPADAPRDIWDARSGAVAHALLQNSWFDLNQGLRRRAWQGLAHAVHRQPSILKRSEIWHFLPRLLLLTAARQAWYRRVMLGLKRSHSRALA